MRYKSVMIGQWEKQFTQSTAFLRTIFFGESNGSAGLVTARAFRAIQKSTFAWRSFPPAKRIRSARNRVPFKERGQRESVLACCLIFQLLQYGSSVGPVVTDLTVSRRRLYIDTSARRTVALADLADAIPRSSYDDIVHLFLQSQIMWQI